MSDCDSLKDQEQTDQLKSTHKRRSLVFQHVSRRIEEDSFDDVKNAEGNENCSEETGDKDFVDLRSYIEELRNERREWKATLTARKSRRRYLQKQRAVLRKNRVDLDVGVLSECERSFLLSRPRYEHICKNIKILSDAAVKIATLNREIDVLNDRLTSKMEEKLLDATKNLIDMSSDET